MLSPFYLIVLPSLLLLSVNAADAKTPVELSYDGGKSWKLSSADSQHRYKSLPATVLFRLKDSPSFISLPKCAVESGPGTFEWRGMNVLGVYPPSMCNEDPDTAFKHLYTNPVNLAYPTWHKYLHAADGTTNMRVSPNNNNNSDSDDEGDGQGGQKEKRKSFWRKYGLYIGAFVVISLVQGIREGNAQYEKEQEHIKREAARRLEERTGANIVVPSKRKAKGKKGGAKKSN